MIESELAVAVGTISSPRSDHHLPHDVRGQGPATAGLQESTVDVTESALPSLKGMDALGEADNQQVVSPSIEIVGEELDEVDIGAPEGVVDSVEHGSAELESKGLERSVMDAQELSEVNLETPRSDSEGATLQTSTDDQTEILMEEHDSPELDEEPLSASTAGPSRPTSRQSQLSRASTPPIGQGRPPKPPASDPPRPLSPSRYRPYGLRQSSNSTSAPSSRSTSANDNHLDSSSSTPSSRQVSPSTATLDLPTSRSTSPSPAQNEPFAERMERSASISSHSTDEDTPLSATNTPRRLAGPPSSPLGFKAISPRAIPSNSAHTSPTYRLAQPFGTEPRFAQDIAAYSPGDTAPRSVPFRPALPTAALALNGQTIGADGSTPFESIDLDTGSPVVPDAIPHSASVATFDTVQRNLLPAHSGKPGLEEDKKLKRRSWGGFGTHKPTKSQSLGPPVETERRHSSAEEQPQRPSSTQPTPTISENAEAGPSSPHRKHAPPAHPHPFPIPTSPALIDKRDSVSRPESIQSTVQPKSPTLSPPNGTHPPPAQGLGVKGVSTFEKVISHTRPSWLPPKAKEEDEAHYHQWEEMMTQAREVDAARRKIQEARRLEREKKLAVATPRWEALLGTGPGGSTMSGPSSTHLKPNESKQMSRSASGSSSKSGAVTPNGTHEGFSVEKVKSDIALRKLWFEGVPSHLRGRAWHLAIGNPLALSKDAYKTYHKRAQRALDSGRFPEDILERLDQDMDQTLPHLRLFVPGSPMRQDLREFVCAWVVYRSDTGNGYAPYITHLSAMFLLTSPPALAFHSLVNFLSRPCLHAFYTETTDEIDAFYRVFENLQADKFPKIFANCKNLGLKLPESYFRTVFLEQVSFESCCRLWDQIVLDGDGYIFRAALAIFGFLEPRLHFPDKEEIESVLEGRNRATLAIAERERERAKLKGEVWDDTVDGTLSVFGLNEDALFDWLENDDWKESRFARLVSREMPD